MLKLHFAPNSRAERIVWLLEEENIDYELNKMKFHPSALKSDEHRLRHPLGRIPVLEDNDIVLYESGAIVEYLITKHTDGKLKPDIHSKEYPLYLQWFHYCEGMVMPPMNTIVVQTIILPKERQNPEILAQAKKLLYKSIVPVDINLKEKKYLIGEFSGADVMLGHSIYMANRLGCVDEEMLGIKKYLERIESRDSFKKATSV